MPPFEEAPAVSEPTPLEPEPGPEPAPEAPPSPELDLADEPAPPSWDEPQPIAQAASQEPDDALDALTEQPAEADGFGLPETPAIEMEEVAEGGAAFDEPPSPPELEALSDPLADALPEPLADASPEPLSDALADADPFAGVGADIPFESPAPLDAEPSDEADVGPGEEELFDTSPPPPSWGDIAENCMALAHATGALLADPGGQLVAVRGSWPEPGAEAIAIRLVAMMDRTLRDAPTRSVSAPVGPQHLTAWRVPVGDRLLTTAFLADAPVGADARPSIDAEIQSGASA
jgi:hypothetical protein